MIRPVSTETIAFGSSSLRLQQQKDGSWKGIVVGKAASPIAAATRDQAIRQLQTLALSKAPEFVGWDGARRRFLEEYPEGFSDRRFLSDGKGGERTSKLQASERALDLLPPEALSAVPNPGARFAEIARMTELVDWRETDRICKAIEGDNGRELVSLCAEFALGDRTAACSRFATRYPTERGGTWPVLTLLPFLWRPAELMFLRPAFTREFARRVGHPFDVAYESRPNAASYAALLDLAGEVHDRMADLEPRDMIDVQGFMWVTVMYARPAV